MSSGLGRVDWLSAEVETLGRRGMPREAFFRELAPRLRRVVDSDALCWHTLDPRTLLMTSDSPEELVDSGVFTPETAQDAGRLIVAGEYLGDGINTFASLARRRMPVAILSETTRGRPERSARYRDLLAPAGIPFEMRATFATRGRAWGALHLARREGDRDFAAADATALARVTGAIAEAIRGSLRFDAARRADGPGSPGLIVLDASGDTQLITPPARELLDALRGSHPSGGEDTPPSAVLALASHARRSAREGAPVPPPVAVPSAVGWVTLHASVPEGGSGSVAVVLERVASEPATALRLETYGVTEREREIAALLARGLSNAEIADTLVLSPYTVQDHLKSLFEKTGVSSRQELVARVFFDDYLPRVAAHAPLASSGGFATYALSAAGSVGR